MLMTQTFDEVAASWRHNYYRVSGLYYDEVELTGPGGHGAGMMANIQELSRRSHGRLVVNVKLVTHPGRAHHTYDVVRVSVTGDVYDQPESVLEAESTATLESLELKLGTAIIVRLRPGKEGNGLTPGIAYHLTVIEYDSSRKCVRATTEKRPGIRDLFIPIEDVYFIPPGG